MNVLVAGGAGYIGSHAVRRLLRAGHQVTVLDNLSHSRPEMLEAASTGFESKPAFVQASISDCGIVRRVLERMRIEVVMHFGAFIEVGESVEDPGKYYCNNAAGTFALLDAMRQDSVKKLVFSSTAAVYGNPSSTPITEDQPRAPINPYGRSKMMAEMAIEDFSAAHGFGCTILRYFNVAGASPDGVIGEAHEPETHLIPRILDAAAGRASAIGIYGTDYPTRDGTCIRDYVHVEDLIEAHLLAMNSIQDGTVNIFNLGSESGFTVREVIHACERVTGVNIPKEEKPRRAGDPPVLVASSSRIRQRLGWRPKYPDLDSIVSHAWRWHQAKPKSNPLSALTPSI